MICPKCKSEHSERCGAYVEDEYEVEYSLRCKDCGEKIGTYAYCSWFSNEDYKDEE